MMRHFWLVPVALLLLISCGGPATGPEESVAPGIEIDQLPPEDLLSSVTKPWKGDLDDMIERRVIRALVVYNSTNFFFDEEAKPRGISHDFLREFEKVINQKLGKAKARVHVVEIPVRRDVIIPHLRDGYADLALGNLTITDERRELVDFSIPGWSGVDEVVVTGPQAPELSSLEDLAGQEVWVRESSSYYQSLQALNKSFKEQGLKPVEIKKAEEQFETEDLLEMVSAGIFGITVADNYIAEAWGDVLDGLVVHTDLTLRTGGEIGWMFRHDSPKLAEAVNAFIKENKQGNLLANMLVKRYYTNSEWIKNSTKKDEVEKLRGLSELFKNYASEYDFDWLLIAAQAYQESGLDHSARSSAGAIGVMQMLKSTAQDPNVNIPDIEQLENNIHAGNKYMRFILDHYFADAEMDKLNKHLFAFASYNAGPNRIARLRKQAAEQGYDPNVWFDNVEMVVGREVGSEPVKYVSNIFKYYVAYRLSLDQIQQRKG
jgi:membrane-bound lytic murein transglycosylase MltF